jgi:hypothetical protein
VILGVLVAVLIPRAPGNQSRRFPPSPDGPPLRYGGFLTATSTPIADCMFGDASPLLPYYSLILESNRHPDLLDEGVPLCRAFAESLAEMGRKAGLLRA